MYILLVILRLVHIVAGAFWVGAALMLTFFISPTVNATENAGKQFMGHFMRKTSFNLVMWSAALLTIIAGMILFWFSSNGLSAIWMGSGTGIAYSLAALSAFLGFFVGMFQSKNSRALAMLGGQIQAQGSPPSPEQAAQLQKIGKALAIGGKLNATFLILATAGMAVARYLVF